ncbi:recombinase family protein [Parasphingorhabdus sp.]|uniref:recombinase family protein n=1 Tax=Parasphingorhabdus sp. TaxID=2709688 RepID=UPI003D2C58CC
MGFWKQFDGCGRKIGYARVSTKSQKLDMQIDALKSVGCDYIFTDHGISGGIAKRDGLDEALSMIRKNDVFIVFKLCRLGRSVLHLADILTRFGHEEVHFCSLSEGIDTTTSGGRLIFHLFSALAEFNRDLIRENTIAGLESAVARGVKLGPKFKLDEFDILEAHRGIYQYNHSVSDMAERYDVSIMTLRRGFERLGLDV